MHKNGSLGKYPYQMTSHASFWADIGAFVGPGIAIYFIVFEGKKCSSASARECFFPKQTMKYVALNARLSPL